MTPPPKGGSPPPKGGSPLSKGGSPLSKGGSPNAIEKLVAVVEVLATQSKVSRIARQTGLATSTVHRILQNLVQVGWAHEDEEHGYMLGSRLLAITARADDAASLAQIAMPHLRELRDATGDTVHLAMRRGDEMVYIAKLDGRKAYQMRSHVGLTIPMHCTAVGKAMLAATDADDVRATLARVGLPARTEHTITGADAMLAHLAAVRAQGYAIDEQENEANIRCVGAVIVGQRGLPVGAVSMSSLIYDLTDAKVPRCAQLVMDAARRISQALGMPLPHSRPSPQCRPPDPAPHARAPRTPDPRPPRPQTPAPRVRPPAAVPGGSPGPRRACAADRRGVVAPRTP